MTPKQLKFVVDNKPQMTWPSLRSALAKEFGELIPDRTLRRHYANLRSPETILTISDMHIPFHHADSFEFLKAIKKKYRPDKVVCMGDLNDWHPISFHKYDPDLHSPRSELKLNQKFNQKLEKIFPEMYVISSNHGDLPLRKIVDTGLPRSFLRDYQSIYGVGEGWKFVDDLIVNSCGKEIYFVHGISKNGLKLTTQRGLCTVQGHYHTVMKIDYVSNPSSLLWSMQVGCLIDKKSLAFEYGKLTLDRPIIGTGIIINGIPKLLPMPLDNEGRWTGELS